MIAVLIKVDGNSVMDALREVSEKLAGGGGEVVLDFSSVSRVEAGDVHAMEQLAALGSNNGVRVALRGVNVDIYKVLKLTKLAPRFSFLP